MLTISEVLWYDAQVLSHWHMMAYNESENTMHGIIILIIILIFLLFHWKILAILTDFAKENENNLSMRPNNKMATVYCKIITDQ